MIARRKRSDRRIFFPWEGRGGLARAIQKGRVRPILLVSAVIAFLVVVAVRERRRAGVRQTRATLLDVRKAVDAYMAANDGGCPPSLQRAVEAVSYQGTIRDAWGRPVRLSCPGGREGEAYELLSDGPDGKPGGLDRIR